LEREEQRIEEREREYWTEMKVLEGERRIEEIDVGLGGREKEKGRFGETDREKKLGRNRIKNNRSDKGWTRWK
jgi:hypothetical protein